MVFTLLAAIGTITLLAQPGAPDDPPPRRVAPGLGPSGVGAKPCCHDCAAAQRRGEMAYGTTCAPCSVPTRRVDPITSCDPLPYCEPQVDTVAAYAQVDGVRDPGALALIVLETLYPSAGSTPIDWRRVGNGWDQCLCLLKTRVYARCVFLRGVEMCSIAADSWAEAGLPEVP